jgi:hypothetical protein
MVNMYGDTTYCFEVLGPADKFGEADTIAFTDDNSKVAANMWLRQQIVWGKLPKGSSIYRDITTDTNAKKAGYTISHYDVIGQ